MLSAAPFPPLVAGGAGLERAPEFPHALRKRMAEVYGVEEACVLPVRGAAHGFELILRQVALDGASAVSARGVAEVAPLARLTRLQVAPDGALAAALFVASPDWESGQGLDTSALRALARDAGPALLVVDERMIEFGESISAASLIGEAPNFVVVRSLELAYGLAGAPCGALIANADLIARLADVCEPNPLAAPVVSLAQAALDPTRGVAQAARIALLKRERARLLEALRASGEVAVVQAGDAPFLLVTPKQPEKSQANTRALAAPGDWFGGVFRLEVRDSDTNERGLAAFGVTRARTSRAAEVVRETNETRIVACVDLDAPAPVSIHTGVEFYDHMLTQVAVHGGFSLVLSCDGDLGVDAHHTIEDCALALGQALSQALAERRGIARFGFVLPMDEARAQVSVDLGGRPYLVFDGAFSAPLIGAYATEMTEHVFRSLAQSMNAAIHVSVTGDNDHHKTEACFKAFGRALRQALRVEGDAVPSTKGVI